MKHRTKRERAGKRAIAGQKNGEKVITVERQFPIVLRKPLLIGLILVLLSIIPWAIATYYNFEWINYAVYWLIAWLIILFWYWLRSWVGWFYSVYVLTNQRILLVSQHGFFSREVNDLTLNNIQNVSYKVSGFQAAMFGFGTVTIETLSGSKPLRLHYIDGPADFAQSISTASRAHTGS